MLYCLNYKKWANKKHPCRTGWTWTDYMTLERKVVCSCIIVYESEYVDNNNESLEEFVERGINDLIDYLDA